MLTMQAANMGGERFTPQESYTWVCERQSPLPSSHVWLCRYDDRSRWPLSAHQYGMTTRAEGEPAPSREEPINGFGVVFAIGPVAFWLFGYDLPGPPPTQGGSDDKHVFIWPGTGADVHWPPRETLHTEAELEELARRMPAGTQVHGPPLL